MNINVRYVLFFLCFTCLALGLSAQVTTDSLNTQPEASAVIPDSLSKQEDTLIQGDRVKKLPTVLQFIKPQIVLDEQKTAFNILVIRNTTGAILEGELSVYAPEGWNILSATDGSKVNIAPGDSAFIPIRVSPGIGSKGGVANIINIALKTKTDVFSANFYVQLPRYSRWTLSTDKNTIFFNEYFEDVKFSCRVANQGNSDEMIKLTFETGKLLVVDELQNEGRGSVLYIPLGPGEDSIINLTVRANSLTFDDQDRFEQIWKESTITIRGNTNDYQTKQTIWFKKINNEYDNRLNQSLFPLNVAVQFNNLLSSIQPRTNATIYGTTLLEEDREISYRLGVLNANLNANSDQPVLENDQNLIYTLSYQDSNKAITLGNLRSTGVMFAGIGRGVSGRYIISPDHNVGAAYSRNILLPIDNYSIQYNTTAIKKLSLSAAANYEDNQLNDNTHLLGQLRANYVLYKRHRLSAGFRGVSSNLEFPVLDSTVRFRDTSLFNSGYELGYAFNSDRIRTQWRYLDYRQIQSKAGGNQFVNGSIFYFFKDRSRLHGLYNRQFQDLNRFPSNLVNDKYELVNELARLTYGKNINRTIFYEIGPLYNYFRRLTPPSLSLQEQFASRTISLYASTRFQMGQFSSMSPFVSYGLTYIELTDDEVTSIPLVTDRPATSLRAGFNFRDRYWGITTFYSNGPVNFFEAQSFANQGIRTQVLNVRPSYQRSFYRNKLRLAAFFNYINRSPSIRENTTFTTRLDYHPNNKWHIYTTTNVFSSSYVDTEEGRVTNRNFNIIAGVRKSFDIQQPRTKVYDLKIVIFNDINGNKVLDPSDRPLANVLTEIEAIDFDRSKGINNFRQMEFVSDPDGTISYYGLAMGEYKLKFLPIQSLENIYNINGIEQTIILNSNQTIYIPYGESYKIMGKLELLRDEYSTEGAINVGGVRVTARGPDNEVYSVLTDREGNYMLYLPQAEYYNVSVANVFGERFSIENDSFNIQFTGFKSYKLDFRFREQKREVKINGDYNFNLQKND